MIEDKSAIVELVESQPCLTVFHVQCLFPNLGSKLRNIIIFSFSGSSKNIAFCSYFKFAYLFILQGYLWCKNVS